MAGIQDFIQMASQNLGINQETASAATGGILGFMKEKVGGADFDELLGRLPGAENLLHGSEEGAEEHHEGMMGGLMKKVTEMLHIGGGAGLAGMLGGSGLDAAKLGPFVSMFVGFLKENANGGLAGRLLDKVPELSKFMGK
ncbi:MAG: hypothetical protein C0617_09950 [Desulfuromonas sp.]|uniref:DUF2780 domain-containing protein n=1 Tax=Desulfuromonas sp. TaxID=892 RepID=UPI000CC114A6|nr:DUF2780 domain-containing protein [Desulfuromonas sp.]PLX83842.1 MAG: hypothetical protein C0617_09950 [Desulfuromonas sp.]